LDFKVTVLGTCSATFAWGRHQSATLVQFDNLHFLIDCGEGTQLQFIDHKVKTAKLEAIFISHLHGDHYLGLVGLLGTMSMGGRKKSLTIYSPVGLKEIIEVQFKHSGTILNYELNILEHQADSPEVIAQFQYFKVSTLPLQHRVPCTGYLFEETIAKRKFRSDLNLEVVPLLAIKAMKEGEDYDGPEGKYFAADWIEETRPPRKFAYCSDTIYLPHLAAQIIGVDFFFGFNGHNHSL
jgi:ribonuclease Z